MNSKLKKLEELEKLLPRKACTHRFVVTRYYGDLNSQQEVERARAEIDNCVACRQDSGKVFLVITNFGPCGG